MRRSVPQLLRAVCRAGTAAAAETQVAASLRNTFACNGARASAVTMQRMAFPMASSMPTRSFASKSDSDSDEEWEEELQVLYPPVEAKVGESAPSFSKLGAVVDGEIKKVSLSDYKGKWVYLFFYPKDFTFVCPTEIIAFSDRSKEFSALNCQVIAASTDTEETHLAWIRTPRNRGGLGYMQIPILADTTKTLAARYGVLIEKLGIALRGSFLINPEGIIQHSTINDLPIGRSVDEALRVLQAAQYVAKHGEVCPANWVPGAKTMVADPDKSMDYFSTVKTSADSEEFSTKLKTLRTKKEYEAAIASGPAVVDFYAPWCGKCRQIAPFVDGLVDKYPGVSFYKVDTTDEHLQGLAADLGVKAMPAFKLFKGGKEVVPEVVGYKKQPLEAAVAKLSKE